MNDTLVYVHDHVADHLQNIGNKSHIIEFIEGLRSNPEAVGDHREPDPRGRMIEIKILKRHALLFFKDPFAGIVKILDLQNVESP
ncbi:MAG: hypothetical protein ACPHNY_05380 [Akkermansiaceae bacterium]